MTKTVRDIVFLAVLLAFTGCASVNRTYDLNAGMTKDEVDDKLGSPETTQTSPNTGKEMRTYRLQRAGVATQIIGGLFTFGMFPFLFPGKQNYYTLHDKDGKLIACSPSSWAIAAQSAVGVPIADMYGKWGAPQDQQDVPNKGKAYIYMRNTGSRTNSYYSGDAQTTMRGQTNGTLDSYGNYNARNRGIASTSFSGSGISSSYAVYCRITFITDDSGVIKSAVTEGNNCNY